MEDRRADTREGGAALHRRHHLPGGRGRRGGHPPARLLAHRQRRHLRRRRPRHRRSTSATSSTSTGSRCCAARRRCCSGAARPAASSTRSARRRCSATISEVSATVGSGSYLRLTGDFNLKTSETSALRLNAMTNTADNYGNIDRQGRHRADLPLGHRHGRRVLGRLLLSRQPQRHQLRHALAARERLGADQRDQSGRAAQGRPEELLRRRQRLQRRLRRLRHAPLHPPLPGRRRTGTRCCAAAATTATSGPRRSASACARPTRRAWSPIPTARRSLRPRRTVNDATPLTRGTQNKVQDLTATYLQTDYSNELQLVRPAERAARRRRPVARGVQQLQDGAAGRRRAQQERPADDDRHAERRHLGRRRRCARR